jgi:hypothetical protein
MFHVNGIFYLCRVSLKIARVAELVDALVSKTNEVILVPVRSRPRVQTLKHKALTMIKLQGFYFLLQKQYPLPHMVNTG